MKNLTINPPWCKGLLINIILRCHIDMKYFQTESYTPACRCNHLLPLYHEENSPDDPFHIINPLSENLWGARHKWSTPPHQTPSKPMNYMVLCVSKELSKIKYLSVELRTYVTRTEWVNSLNLGSNFKSIILKLIIQNSTFHTCKIPLWWMTQNLTNEKSTLV